MFVDADVDFLLSNDDKEPRTHIAMETLFARYAWLSLTSLLALSAGCTCMSEPSTAPPQPAVNAAQSQRSMDEQVKMHLSFADEHIKVVRDESISWLLARPDEVAPVVAQAVRNGTAPSPSLYLSLLGYYGRPQDVPAMEAALQRAIPGESFYAAAALASHRTHEAREVLLRGLTHQSPTVRGNVADMLIDSEMRWACAGLSLRFDDPDPDVRFRVLRAAFRVGCIDAAMARARAHTLDDEARDALEALFRDE